MIGIVIHSLYLQSPHSLAIISNIIGPSRKKPRMVKVIGLVLDQNTAYKSFLSFNLKSATDWWNLLLPFSLLSDDLEVVPGRGY